MRSVFELFSSVISAKISAVQVRDLLNYQASKHDGLTQLLQALYKQKETKHVLRHLLEADGLALVTNDNTDTEGTTPLTDEIRDLVVWLNLREDDTLFHHTNLSAVYEPAEAYAERVSGLLAVPLEKEGNFILAFRQEAVTKIAWGGNPDEAVQMESDGKKYHPRASFKQWQQTVRQTSLPWSGEVLQTAQEVRQLFFTYKS